MGATQMKMGRWEQSEIEQMEAERGDKVAYCASSHPAYMFRLFVVLLQAHKTYESISDTVRDRRNVKPVKRR